MLLYIYLGTTVYVWIDTIKSMINNDKRLKREGYKFIAPRFNGLPDIIVGVIYGIAMSIPVFNLMFPLSNKDKEKSYEEYKNMMLEAGSIEEPKQLNQQKKEEKTNMNIIDVNDSKLKARTNRDGHIYYSSMEEEHEVVDYGYTYKKELKKRRY